MIRARLWPSAVAARKWLNPNEPQIAHTNAEVTAQASIFDASVRRIFAQFPSPAKVPATINFLKMIDRLRNRRSSRRPIPPRDAWFRAGFRAAGHRSARACPPPRSARRSSRCRPAIPAPKRRPCGSSQRCSPRASAERQRAVGFDDRPVAPAPVRELRSGPDQPVFDDAGERNPRLRPFAGGRGDALGRQRLDARDARAPKPPWRNGGRARGR